MTDTVVVLAIGFVVLAVLVGWAGLAAFVAGAQAETQKGRK